MKSEAYSFPLISNLRATARQWSSYLREEEKLLWRWRWRSVRICRLRSENKSLCYSDTWAHQTLIGCGMRARCVCRLYVYVRNRWRVKCVCACVRVCVCLSVCDCVCVGGGSQPWPWRRRWMKYCGWKRRAQVLERSSWEASVAKFTVIEGWEGGYTSAWHPDNGGKVCVCLCLCVYKHQPHINQSVNQSDT